MRAPDTRAAAMLLSIIGRTRPPQFRYPAGLTACTINAASREAAITLSRSIASPCDHSINENADGRGKRTALVLGATGGVGGETAAALLRNGWYVKALARDAVKAAARNAPTAQGDDPC